MDEELDAEEEDALALIAAACLRRRNEVRWSGADRVSFRRTCRTRRHPPGLGQGSAIGLTVVV